MTSSLHLPSPMLRQLLHHPNLGEAPNVVNDSEAEPAWTMEKANLVTSRLGYSASGEFHALVLDVDAPVYVVESSTPGHHHVYIDVPMCWQQAVDILVALRKGGVIDPTWFEMSLQRNYMAVRTPWTSKRSVDWGSS